MRAESHILEPFGPTNRSRQLAGAVVVMAGALPVAMVADAYLGPPPRLYYVLLAVGLVATLGWLVDGRAYLGPGTTALAVGLGITVSRSSSLADNEYSLVFGLIGAAMLLMSQVNPRAMRGAAGLLLYLAASAAWLHEANSPVLPAPVLFGGIMLVWGGVRFRRALAAGTPLAVRARKAAGRPSTALTSR